MLERRLGVTSFPTYMIMDKTGKIVDMNPPVPMNTDALINELKKWTEK
jgi:thioredoxin-related protein